MAGEKDTWEVYQDRKKQWRWRRKASNGNIVGAATESYLKEKDCIANAQRHGMNGNPKKQGKSDKWEFYKDKKGEHRWRRRASNGNIVGASSESYKNKKSALANAERNGYAGK